MTVGLFNSSRYCCRKKFVYMWSATSEFLLLLRTLFGPSSALLSGCIIRPFVLEMTLLLIDALRFLLLLSGDIELNPGPDYKALSVLHLNVRSIRNKLDYVTSNLCNFDILCFTETHLTDVVPDNVLTIEGFNTGFHRKDYTPHSSGLLIYVNESLLSRRVIENVPVCTHYGLNLILATSPLYLLLLLSSPNSNVSFWNDLETYIDRA